MEQFLITLIAYIFSEAVINSAWKVILNTFVVVMIGGILKSIAKLTPLKYYSKIRKLILSLCNIAIGGVLGFFLYSFALPVSILIGCCSGYFSSILYSVFVKELYKKYGINADDYLGVLNSGMPNDPGNNKEKENDNNN